MKYLILFLLIITIYSSSCNKDNCSLSQTYGSFEDERDNEIYQTVTICNQIWMAENLRFNAPNSRYDSNNPSSKYGRLYNWSIVMNGAFSSSSNPSGVQGICPNGWHVPSDLEWQTLEKNLGMNRSDLEIRGQDRGTNEGTKIKSISGWDSNYNGTDDYGFNALPAGLSGGPASASYLGSYAGFTSTTIDTLGSRVLGRFVNTGTTIARGGHYKSTYLSCRCIKD